MSISQNFPSSRPSLNLDFARSKKLDPRIAFSRASTGTYVDEDGLIKTASANTPRFEHNPTTGESLGLLVETTRTNLILGSEDFGNNAYWATDNAGLTITANSTTAPDGTTTADTLVEANTNTFHNRYQTIGLVTTNPYTWSVFLKPNTITKVALSFGYAGIGGGGVAYFNLANGTVNSTAASGVDPGTNLSASITPYLNGWYRCSFTLTPSRTDLTYYAGIQLVDSNYNLIYQGNTANNLYVWGGQLESYAHGTSYIPTTTATVTRNEDYVFIRSGSNFTNFYNPYEGTFVAVSRKYAFGDTARFPGVFYVDDGTFENSMGMVYVDAGADDLTFEGFASNVSQFYLNKEISVANKQYKSVGAYKVNDTVYTQNGISPVSTDTDASSTIPTVNRLVIAGLRSGNFADHALNGTLSKLTYYPVRLPNSQLIELSK